MNENQLKCLAKTLMDNILFANCWKQAQGDDSSLGEAISSMIKYHSLQLLGRHLDRKEIISLFDYLNDLEK